MSTIQTVLAALGGLIVVAGAAATIWAYVKGGAQDNQIERLRGEVTDYLSRLNYIEPRFKASQEQNEILRTLVDPSGRLDEIRSTVTEKSDEILRAVERSASNTEAMKAVLLAQARTLDDIGEHMHPRGGGSE